MGTVWDRVIDTAADWAGVAFIATVLGLMLGAPDMGMPEGIKVFFTIDASLLALAATPD